MHISAATLEHTAAAFRYVDTELKPDFVLFTGDNNGYPGPPDGADASESRGLRRQRFLKRFLEQHLKTPYVIIPGDNWPEAFDQVFGPKQFSFDRGGLHFLLLAPDRAWSLPKNEGLSVFDSSTWDWIEQDLNRNRERPTIVAIHEPVFPPTFLDAPRLRQTLARHPNVIAVLQGHLHVDMQLRADGKAYLVAPSLARPPQPGMKVVDVYPTGLRLRTVVYREPDNQFEMQARVQRIDVPAALQAMLAAPADAPFTMKNYESLPASPLVEDPSLQGRSSELIKNAFKLLLPSTPVGPVQ